MHELSIAHSLVRIATDAAQEAQVSHVNAVHLQLGVLSGVVKDALLFSFDIATENTPLAGSKLLIEELPLVIFCQQCDEKRTLDNIQSLCCPVCQQPSAHVIQGKEMQLISLEYADATEIA